LTILQIAALAGLAGLLLYIFKQVSLSDFLTRKKQQHLVFGCSAAVFTLWIFRAGIYDGLSVHFLWLPALALTLGLRWGIICASVALLGVTAVGIESWSMLGVNGLLGIVLPMCLSYLVLMLAFHKLPRHLFVYIFVCAFFPGAMAIAFKMLLLTSYYAVDGIYTWQVAYENYLILTPLMLFPEAMLNGMTMTLMVIYKPDWVYTFHDKFYLDK